MVPILIAQISTAGISFINTSMAGHASADDLAGVSVGAGLFYPFLAAVIGLLMAGTPIMAQLVGRKDKASIPDVVRAGLVIGLVLDVLFAAGYFFGIDSLMAYMQLTPEVEHIARAYIFCMVIAMFFIDFLIPLRCLTDTAGSTSISMMLFMSAIPIDALCNYVLIYGHFGFPRLGGIGAGVSTAVTFAFLLVLFVLVIARDPMFMGKSLISSCRVALGDIKEYLEIGIPSGLSVLMEESCFALIIVFLSKYGTNTLAAYQIANNYANLVFMIPVSCSMALTILVAVHAGAGHLKEARDAGRAGMAVALFSASMTVILTVLCRYQIGALYSDDPYVIEIAGNFLLFSAGWQIFDAVSTPIQGILRGFKDTRVSFLLMLAAYWGVCFPVGLFLDAHSSLGAYSFWIGLDSGVFCSAVFMILRLVYVTRTFTERAVVEPVPSVAVRPALAYGKGFAFHGIPAGTELYADHAAGNALHVHGRAYRKWKEMRDFARQTKISYLFNTWIFQDMLDHAIGRATRAFVP